MNWEAGAEFADERVDHFDKMVRANADNTGPEWAEWLGPPVTLWRRFRDGEETEEVLPRVWAEWTLLAIPEQEPGVERAKIASLMLTSG